MNQGAATATKELLKTIGTQTDRIRESYEEEVGELKHSLRLKDENIRTLEELLEAVRIDRDRLQNENAKLSNRIDELQSKAKKAREIQ